MAYLGDMEELGRRQRSYLRQARERGDDYLETCCLTGHLNLTWLAGDDPEGARRAADEAMDLWSQMLTPLMSLRMPCSGDVLMNYSPWTNWGWSDFDAGNPDMEQDIFTHVALPGKQLGGGKLKD